MFDKFYSMTLNTYILNMLEYGREVIKISVNRQFKN